MTLRSSCTVMVLLAVALPVDAQQAVLADSLASPAMASLAHAVASGEPGAAAAFWQRVERSGTPLVEPDPAFAGHSLVTFLYRAADNELAVDLASAIVSLDPESEATSTVRLPLRRLAGTDVHFLTFRLRADVRAPYHFGIRSRGHEREQVLDPLNGKVWEPDQSALAASLLELPGAPPQPWRQAGAEAGDWDELSLSDAAGDERTVYVYKPVGWVPDRPAPYPALLGLGAFGTGIGMRVDWMADHLIQAGALPPTVFVLMDLQSGSEAERYESTDAFVIDVVLPYVREHYQVSTRSEDVVVSGTSRRGLVAALMALRNPEMIGNVLSLSGSYYWKPHDEGAWVWLAREFAAAERRPVRFYVAAGELETFVNPGNHGHYLVGTNRHVRDVLRARGYDLSYVEFNGVHSELNWQDWLADGLVHLLGRGAR